MSEPVDITPGPGDGWNGNRVPIGEFGRLLAQLRDLSRRISALERAAPGRASGVTYTETGVQMSLALGVSGALSVTGSATLGTSTTIAGVGMNTFITATQATTAEVIAARATWSSIGERMTQIRILAQDVTNEVTGARGGHSNLDARLDDISGSIPSGAIATLQSQMSTVGSAITIITDTVDSILSRLNDIDGKGLAPGTWPPPLPTIPP